MRKEDARIFLKVTDVRVERLHDITDDGAIKEGIDTEEIYHLGCTPDNPYVCVFSGLWESIYSNWDSNPWVYVFEFEKIDKPESDGE